MNNLSKGLKTAVLLSFLALYISIFWTGFGKAIPAGASLTTLATDFGPNSTADSRTDSGGTITTINLDTVQQNPGWKAYIGNITGSLVLRNANDQSIYEWALADDALSGNVFITRSNDVNWTPIKCANSSDIATEDLALGFAASASDNLNRTFNYTAHQSMTISGIGTINGNTCRSTATWVNDTVQIVSNTSSFQEILLHDTVNLVYGTFIDQDSLGFDGNDTNGITHDFQIIVGDPKNATDLTYYFYADIS